MTPEPPAPEETEAAALRRVLDQLATLVPYLRAEVGPVACAAPGTAAGSDGAKEEGGWLSCRDLVEDPRRLADVIRASGLDLGTDDPVVAASIFVQGYAYRLLALAVACLAVGGVLPDSRPRATAVRLSRGRPASVAYLAPKVSIVGRSSSVEAAMGDERILDGAVRLLLDGVVEWHLRPLITSVRAEVRIGERLLWGNVAASASTAFRTMQGCLGTWIEPLGQRFFELAPPELRGLGTFLVLEADGRHGWFWERTNCCLYDRLPGGIRCADCSRTPTQERRAAYAASLAP